MNLVHFEVLQKERFGHGSTFHLTHTGPRYLSYYNYRCILSGQSCITAQRTSPSAKIKSQYTGDSIVRKRTMFQELLEGWFCMQEGQIQEVLEQGYVYTPVLHQMNPLKE